MNYCGFVRVAILALVVGGCAAPGLLVSSWPNYDNFQPKSVPAEEAISTEGLPEVEGTPCNAKGIEDCLSIQFAMAKSNPGLTRALWTSPGRSGSIVLDAFQAGTAQPAGPQEGYVYLWLKPEVKRDPNFRIPWNLMYTMAFKGPTGERYDVQPAEFVRHRPYFPTLDDPRYEELGDPDYVIWLPSVDSGAALNIPKTLRDKLILVFRCPVPGQITDFPDNNGSGKRQGVIVDMPRVPEGYEYITYGIATGS